MATERGRIVVGADLAVRRHPGVWAMGDCALVPRGFNGNSAPPAARFAVSEGCLLAHNLRRALAGQPLRAFHHKPLGAMASIGHVKGVAEVLGVPLAGLPAWFVWRAYYLTRMPTLGLKIRIFAEWSWGRFFPNDITHLRFPGSRAVQRSEAATRAGTATPH